MKTVVHVTHEALQKVGGIGAVLQGLCTCQPYQDRVDRDILVGPMFGGDHGAAEQLSKFGEILYSSALGVDKGGWGPKFRPIQQELGVSFIYGRRHFVDEGTGLESWPEVLLVGIDHMHAHPLSIFKLRLYENFGIQSDIYDAWDYEQYTRIAQPAIRALQALGVEQENDEPVTLLAHEYMGMPTALALIMDKNRRWRTFFYAHETATMRRIVEKHPGHDTMFYNAMRAAMEQGQFVDDVFGPQKHYYKHPLVAASRFTDGTLAVGDLVREEMRFLGPQFADFNIRLAYNGIPSYRIDMKEKMRSVNLMRDYAEKLTGNRPDYLLSHVTRMALSKGLWRDLKVLWRLEQEMRKNGQTAVLFVLSSEVGAPRKPPEVLQMEARYGWPLAHREGYPDLSGGEADFYSSVQIFNACSRNVKVIYVNQFGWGSAACGKNMPTEMSFRDIREGTDLEFGQSIYEPFGIAQLEPLAFGGLCVVTDVCGCAGFLMRVAGGRESPNAVLADYTRLPHKRETLDQLLAIGLKERAAIEEIEATRVALEIMRKLPQGEAGRARMLESGYALAQHMGWDSVAKQYILPAMADADAKA